MINWTKLLMPYENKWVAISEDEKSVLASGDDLETVMHAIEEKKLKARYTFVPRFDCVLAPQCQR